MQHGFDREAVIASLADVQERAETRLYVARSAAAGVKSIPHFVFNGRLAINGGRSEAELADASGPRLGAPTRDKEVHCLRH